MLGARPGAPGCPLREGSPSGAATARREWRAGCRAAGAPLGHCRTQQTAWLQSSAFPQFGCNSAGWLAREPCNCSCRGRRSGCASPSCSARACVRQVAFRCPQARAHKHRVGASRAIYGLRPASGKVPHWRPRPVAQKRRRRPVSQRVWLDRASESRPAQRDAREHRPTSTWTRLSLAPPPPHPVATEFATQRCFRAATHTTHRRVVNAQFGTCCLADWDA